MLAPDRQLRGLVTLVLRYLLNIMGSAVILTAQEPAGCWRSILLPDLLRGYVLSTIAIQLGPCPSVIGSDLHCYCREACLAPLEIQVPESCVTDEISLTFDRICLLLNVKRFITGKRYVST
jgi:hypothetical protein